MHSASYFHFVLNTSNIVDHGFTGIVPIHASSSLVSTHASNDAQTQGVSDGGVGEDQCADNPMCMMSKYSSCSFIHVLACNGKWLGFARGMLD